jgi:hypothetical protein
VPAAQRGSAFVRRSGRDLGLIFALQFERTVNRDNTVSIQNLSLQIERVRWRATLAGCSVTVHQHLDGTFTITYAPSVWALQRARSVDRKGKKRRARGCGKAARWKSRKSRLFHLAWKSRKVRGIPTFPQPRRLLAIN